MQFAKIKWNNHQPYSLDFDDIYYSSDDGLAETEHVFIQHNQLAKRFSFLTEPTFTIIETGFGTGLNFFCAAQTWLNHLEENHFSANAKLRFTSIERYPLTLKDFVLANQNWPMFNALAVELQTVYCQLKEGFNQFVLCNGHIQLDLWIGDVDDILPQIQAPTDAWFLDGFAPAKNNAMWSERLFNQMARLSKVQTTFATFTSVGDVRRQLQRIGFQVKKTKGFGKKREMLFGVYG